MNYIPASDRYAEMKYNRCGRSGLMLPAISLGLWHNFGHIDRQETYRTILHAAFDAGITDLIIDPGFGFGKTIEQNYEFLNNLEMFQRLDCPLLIGLSRKSLIYKVLESNPSSALNGTTALHALSLYKGANILRVHDVKEAKECITLLNMLQ